VLSTEPCSILSGLSSPEKRRRQSGPPGAKLEKMGSKDNILYICDAFNMLGGALWAEIIPFSPDQDNACEGKAGLFYTTLLHLINY